MALVVGHRGPGWRWMNVTSSVCMRRSVQGGSMRQKHKQSCFLLVLIFCSGPLFSTELADRSVIRELLTASLFICFSRMP